ncbi:MAG TPA: AAA family ATPase, partial [Ktedonobacteraceae bacterium]
MTRSIVIQSQLLATKFFVPMTSGTLISRPRLHALLDESLKYPLTLVSAPSGFGKTMLLSCWAQSLQAYHPLVAWVSVDEEDNDPRLFWTYVLSALDQQQPERFTPLFKYLQSPEIPPLMHILTALINLVLDSQEHFVVILDDYHLITEQQIHATLSYLVEHLPPQLHIILATQVDPPLPLPLLRAGQHVLEIRTEQLRCTTEETEAFFKEAKGIHLPDETIKTVNARTEGWLVGLQLLSFSLQAGANPATLLEEVSGKQRYILDYLTEVVLRQQSEEMQTFLLSTCILERLTASLCDAVTQKTDSQQMLQRLEQANVFVVALDSKRQWYRYHALFAEALSYQLELMRPDLVPTLHHCASIWYAQHNSTTQAIFHAFQAKEWQWAADLIEGLPLLSLTWGADEYRLMMLKEWLEQLPADVVGCRPRLCLACAQILWLVASHPMLEAWLKIAEATLTASLT